MNDLIYACIYNKKERTYQLKKINVPNLEGNVVLSDISQFKVAMEFLYEKYYKTSKNKYDISLIFRCIDFEDNGKALYNIPMYEPEQIVKWFEYIEQGEKNIFTEIYKKQNNDYIFNLMYFDGMERIKRKVATNNEIEQTESKN